MSFVELTGHAKLDRRTKNLVKRLSADDIAIIDHTDLDRVSAEALLESGVRVVVNVAESQSGRFPNPGPLALVRGGIRLIDVDGADIFDDVHEGELLTVRGAGLYRNGTCLAAGRVLEERELETRARRTARPRDRSPRGIRREHDALPARGGQAARRRDRFPGDRYALPRPSCTRRRARVPVTSATCGWSGRTSATSSRC